MRFTLANRLVSFNLWDTAGQERYQAQTSFYYREADIALVVYDLGSPVPLPAVPGMTYLCGL